MIPYKNDVASGPRIEITARLFRSVIIFGNFNKSNCGVLSYESLFTVGISIFSYPSGIFFDVKYLY